MRESEAPQRRVPAIQIKPLAVALFAVALPDFKPYTKKGGYWFRRQLGGITDILVCTASFKHGAMQIDLYCGLFDDWAGAFGTHLAWSGLRLDNLRYNSGVLNVELIGYRHQQTQETIVSARENSSRQDRRDISILVMDLFRRFTQTNGNI